MANEKQDFFFKLSFYFVRALLCLSPAFISVRYQHFLTLRIHSPVLTIWSHSIRSLTNRGRCSSCFPWVFFFFSFFFGEFSQRTLFSQPPQRFPANELYYMSVQVLFNVLVARLTTDATNPRSSGHAGWDFKAFSQEILHVPHLQSLQIFISDRHSYVTCDQ